MVKRLLKIGVFCIVLVLVVDGLFVTLFPRKSLPPSDYPADAIVVLGAAPNSPAIRNRASKGLELYYAGQAKQLILTGGNTSSRDESEAMNMSRFLARIETTAVPTTLEERSTNTFENLENSRTLVPSAKRIIIVSDTYHLPRAFLIAKRLGFKDVYWESPSSNYYKPSELAWYYGREMVAVLAYMPKFISGK